MIKQMCLSIIIVNYRNYELTIKCIKSVKASIKNINYEIIVIDNDSPNQSYEKILNELIPVIDSMERALEACTDKEDTMFKGVELVYKQLKDMITKFGVEEIEAQDADFDPNLHLAVMQESVDGVEPNKVVMVLQKGYKLGNKVLRASMVKVSC